MITAIIVMITNLAIEEADRVNAAAIVTRAFLLNKLTVKLITREIIIETMIIIAIILLIIIITAVMIIITMLIMAISMVEKDCDQGRQRDSTVAIIDKLSILCRLVFIFLQR